MNEATFKKLIETEIKGLSTEKKIEVLEILKRNVPSWIDEIMSQSVENMWFCKNCQKYYNIEDVKPFSQKEVYPGMLVHSDAGYGDTDEYADVEYLVHYNECPICGAKNIESKEYLSESNNRYRS